MNRKQCERYEGFIDNFDFKWDAGHVFFLITIVLLWKKMKIFNPIEVADILRDSPVQVTNYPTNSQSMNNFSMLMAFISIS